jgi:hypothetical protein
MKHLEGLLRRLFIDFTDGKADMNYGVVSDSDVGKIRQTNFFGDSAEIHAAHARAACVEYVSYLPWYG